MSKKGTRLAVGVRVDDEAVVVDVMRVERGNESEPERVLVSVSWWKR
jgi:hypothetical protein